MPYYACRANHLLAGFVMVSICMTEPGRELPGARVWAGLSVEELSHRTKLSVPTLPAIERNQTDTLPDGLYAWAMLRAYAREVGRKADDNVDPLESIKRLTHRSAARASGRRGREHSSLAELP